MDDTFSTAVTIDSEPPQIWAVLTQHKLMAQWMADPEMKIEVHTNWDIDAAILVQAFHHLKFENKGVVLSFDKEKRLSYSHLSSLSRLPDKRENYSIFEFVLTPVGKQTLLTIFVTNFPTETIRKHLEFYWRGTIVKIKKVVEAQMAQ